MTTTTDPRKLAQEARERAKTAPFQRDQEFLVSIATALVAALDERDAAVAANKAEFEGHKLTIADHRVEIARLQAENERLRETCICEGCHKPMVHICESDECVSAAIRRSR